MKYINIITLAVICMCTAAWSEQTMIDKVPIRDLPFTGGNMDISSKQGNFRQLPDNGGISSPPSVDLIGEIDTVGSTWYDVQHNGTAGRMIKYDNAGWIHVCWMNGLESGATNRHVYYNLMQPVTGWAWGNSGTPVESATRGGYCCLDVHETGYPHIAFHVVVGEVTRTAVAVDLFPGNAAFQYWTIPDVNNRNIIWPRITLDLQNRTHLISTEDDGTEASSPLWYCRGFFDTNMTFNDPIQFDVTETIAADITASRHSDRVAFVYTHPHPTLEGDTTQYNNDLYLVVSEDGVTWDFEHPQNITGFLQPDTLLFPDTTAAMMDTLRAYTDASILFDENDMIHVAFTTLYYDGINGLISINNSLIWHWSEELGWEPSLIADGWWGGVPFECGAWQRFVQRPCLAIDTTSGDLFCTYQHYDTADVSQGGYPQGDIYVSRSTNNGQRWSVGINVTDTHAPNAAPNDCLSERDPSCSETIEDGALYMFYIMDTDAGAIPQDEGSWTLCYA
ncbi:hypothetical protein AMJ86_02535, partial [bacterium SM23_57]